MSTFENSMISPFQKYAKSSVTHADDDMLKRLARHIVLSGWGADEQRRLDSLRIVIIGAGGLGSALGLIISGSLCNNHSLLFVDGDSVEISNLHRQLAFQEDMIGFNKAECMKSVCMRRNSTLNVTSLPEYFSPGNGPALFRNADVAFDCTDNVSSRINISNAWVATGKGALFISASCVGWSGQIVTLFPCQPGCIGCVYKDIGHSGSACEHMGQCAISGVMSPVVATIANFQFLELLRWVRDFDKVQHNEPCPTRDLLVKIFDFSGSSQFERTMRLSPICSHCGDERYTNEDNGKIEQHECNTDRELLPDQFLKLLDSKQCRIIDVREESHYALSHLEESHNVPASKYIHYSQKLPPHIVEMINGTCTISVVVCRRGIDSLRFADTYKGNCVSLKGGLLGLGLRGIV